MDKVLGHRAGVRVGFPVIHTRYFIPGMRRSLFVLVLVALFAAFVGVAAAGVPPRDAAPAAAPTAAPFYTADPTVTAIVAPALERARLPDDRVARRHIVVSGLRLPIDGVPLPDDPELLPNAARAYRAGWHEGIDFPAREGTPVHSVARGVVVRVDREYVEWDDAAKQAALDAAVALGYTPSATLDLIRGRQVWLDHGGGVVSRYAHLSAVALLAVGDPVVAGQVIGAVGSSGLREGGPHLHLEIRIGTSYLGDGLEGDALLAAVRRAFD